MSRFLPSPAMVVAFIALVVAIGGTSYAAIKLPANSVGPKQLKKGAVVRAKIKNGAIDASKLAPNSVTGASINESALGKVPSAGLADHAAGAAALDKISYKSVDGSTPKAPDAMSFSVATLDINCDAGQHPVGGGIRLSDPGSQFIVDGQVNSLGYEYRVAGADPAAAHPFTGTIICVAASSVG